MYHRSTPVETLHTILLGPYKYLTRMVMGQLTTAQKAEVGARLRAFNFSGRKGRIHGDSTRYFGSFVGRDFKAWAQISIFILAPYLQQDEMSVWLSLSKVGTRYYTEVCKWLALQVFQMAYCNQYRPDEKRQLEQVCVDFVLRVCQVYPGFAQKPKVHLLLHLVQCMEWFGSTSAFNTERYASGSYEAY